MTTHDPILWPACLFGMTAATRKAWRAVARAAWRDGSWDGALAQVEHHSVEARKTTIVICNHGPHWRSSQDVWQLNWVADVLPATVDEVWRDSARQFALVLSGMRHLWFTVGMLAPGFTGFYFTSAPRLFEGQAYKAVARDEIFRPWLARYVYWLPELVALSPRFARGVRNVGPVPYQGAFWFHIGLSVSYAAGLSPEALVQRSASIPSSSLIDVLLREGVIEVRGDRYSLKGWTDSAA